MEISTKWVVTLIQGNDNGHLQMTYNILRHFPGIFLYSSVISIPEKDPFRLIEEALDGCVDWAIDGHSISLRDNWIL